MKSYDQMATDVLRRVAAYKVAQKRKKQLLLRTVLPLSCILVIALSGFGVWKSGVFGVTPDTELSDGEQTTAPTLSREQQQQIQQLQTQVGDRIGWVVYENRLYIQVQSVDADTVRAQTFLGRAEAVKGAYENGKWGVRGEMYSVENNPNLILVKLSNGGAVVLQAEE